MEKRSLFKQIFGINKQNKSNHQRLKMLNDFTPVFSTANRINESSLVKACVNTIATHASKFEMVHRQYGKDTIREVNGDINYLLKHRPNPINTPSQFIYKIAYNWAMNNNAFVYIHRDKVGNITGLYPITASNYELLQDESGKNVYLRFNFLANNQTYELPYNELIHIRRFYGSNEIFGDNNSSLQNAVDANETATQGITNAIKATAGLRGIIKFEQNVLKEEHMKKFKDRFVEDYLNLENESGIAVIDSKATFEPIKMDPITLSNTQLQYLAENVYRYFGLNENIVNSNYSDTQWSAFYESVLEPFALQLEQEFTTKIFNDQAIRDGHRINFIVERIKYNKTTTKISLIQSLGQLGILTVDECRAILDMSPFGGEKGNKTLQTLNVVNSDMADEYQLGNDNGGNDE